jgi:hypothetical protein
VSAIAARWGSTARRCKNTSSVAWSRRCTARVRRGRASSRVLALSVRAACGARNRPGAVCTANCATSATRAATAFSPTSCTISGRSSRCASRRHPATRRRSDFVHFRTVFTDGPGRERILRLFSMVLGHSRMLWAHFVLHQDLPTLLRCHTAAFETFGGVPGTHPLRSHAHRGQPRGT